MKILYVLFFISFFGRMSAQDLQKIKNADTIYIYFKEDKKQQIHQIVRSVNKEKKYDNYFFDYSNNQVAFQFSNLKTLNNKTLKKNKNFLKKNKDIILDYEFIENAGNLTIAEMIGYVYDAKKVVYVIDQNDFICFRITLKQVKIVGPVRFSEE